MDVERLAELQDRKTAEWHARAFAASEAELLALAEENHHCNFSLWHEEDRARREDLGYEHVYRAKRNIDGWNQRRNDAIEKMDRALFAALGPFAEGLPMNSETPGMIIDRLSILALKAYHMREEAERASAPPAQREACRGKLAIILRQRADLAAALAELLDACAQKRRGFRVYHQFKMYNDPNLNPELYSR